MKKIICILLVLALLAGSALAYSSIGKKMDILRALEIDIPEEAGAKIEAEMLQMFNDAPVQADGSFYHADFPTILAWLGWGELDEESFNFIPYTDSLYAFDSEAFDISTAYEDLLNAVGRISGGELQFSDIRTELSEELFNAGMGKLPLHFKLNGRDCSYTADFNYDWMDCAIIDCLNEAIAELGMEKCIWTMYDGGQGLVVFYRDEAWVQRFERITGCSLDRGTGVESLLDFFY